jgi:hypothetical protein
MPSLRDEHEEAEAASRARSHAVVFVLALSERGEKQNGLE